MSVLKTVKDGKVLAYRLEGGALIVGKGPGSQIVVDEDGVAARHAQIVSMKEGWFLKDLSGAGVVVNSKRVKERLLCEGDVLVFGTRSFTFAGNPGQNTMRIAAETSPSKGATARVTKAEAAPARAATARVPAATAQAGKNTTSRIAAAAPSGNSTRSVKKPTGRATGRITSRVQKNTATFSMPSTKNGKLMAAGVFVGIVGIVAALLVIRMGQERPEDVKARFIAEYTALGKMPAADLAGKLSTAERLLGDKQYQYYGGKEFGELSKQVPKLREALNEQRAADKDVKPFLTKYDAAKADAATFDAKAPELYDQAKALFDKFQLSAHGPRLTEIVGELKAKLGGPKDSWEKNWVPLTADLQKEKEKGDCVQATRIADAFGEKWKEKEDSQLAKRLTEQRESIKRHADVVVERVKKEVQKLVADGKKDDAKKALDAAKPGLEGFPAAAKLAAFAKEIEQAKP